VSTSHISDSTTRSTFHLVLLSLFFIPASHIQAPTQKRSQEAGQEAFTRYSRLISQTNLPFVRSSGGSRLVESATNWTLGNASSLFAAPKLIHFLGFSIASHYDYNPVISAILPEHVIILSRHPSKLLSSLSSFSIAER
jgi:hypothetical protein